MIEKTKNNNADTFNDRKMVPMTISGFGIPTRAPELLVAFLVPKDKNKYRFDNGSERFFPITIPGEVAQFCRTKISQILSEINHQTLELSHYFEVYTQTKLTELNIYKGKFNTRTYISYSTMEGEKRCFSASIVTGFLTAMIHHLDIFVEEDLLMMSATSSVNLSDDDEWLNAREEGHKSCISAIKRQITDGEQPDTEDLALYNIISTMEEAEYRELFDLAINVENYEWAALFKKVREEL